MLQAKVLRRGFSREGGIAFGATRPAPTAADSTSGRPLHCAPRFLLYLHFSLFFLESRDRHAAYSSLFLVIQQRHRHLILSVVFLF
jgi:hypothetical protein